MLKFAFFHSAVKFITLRVHISDENNFFRQTRKSLCIFLSGLSASDVNTGIRFIIFFINCWKVIISKISTLPPFFSTEWNETLKLQWTKESMKKSWMQSVLSQPICEEQMRVLPFLNQADHANHKAQSWPNIVPKFARNRSYVRSQACIWSVVSPDSLLMKITSRIIEMRSLRGWKLIKTDKVQLNSSFTCDCMNCLEMRRSHLNNDDISDSNQIAAIDCRIQWGCFLVL